MNLSDSCSPSAGKALVVLLALLLPLFFLVGLAQGQPVTEVDQAEILAQFEAELENLRQEMLIPGMSAAVVQDGQLLWAKGFGYADQERQITRTSAGFGGLK